MRQRFPLIWHYNWRWTPPRLSCHTRCLLCWSLCLSLHQKHMTTEQIELLCLHRTYTKVICVYIYVCHVCMRMYVHACVCVKYVTLLTIIVYDVNGRRGISNCDKWIRRVDINIKILLNFRSWIIISYHSHALWTWNAWYCCQYEQGIIILKKTDHSVIIIHNTLSWTNQLQHQWQFHPL